ncbi:AroM family protein [Salinicoccus sp. ID82-1]|uniref:AroM family protein n=1 Tax=Salinicoccus sp. ID82-1 TaxID=2820269 RepID=UPI001F32946B|nr:AroM family protein [Salinicoccus sp. ID82-1]MCG1009704.1 AroM family protein [Salinicoccus sp. ID82-1]
MTNLLAITIGRSPRKDISPIMERYLGDDITVKQMGVLDDLSDHEMSLISTYKPHDEVLVSRVDDEHSIELNAKVVEDHLQNIIQNAEKRGYKHILLLCTGSFPDIVLKTSNLYLPDQIISPVISNIAKHRRMGLLIPHENQKSMMEDKWREYGLDPLIASASPYLDLDEIVVAAKSLEQSNADFILMDCMGYTEEMKKAVSAEVTVPVILSNTLMVKILSELL